MIFKNILVNKFGGFFKILLVLLRLDSIGLKNEYIRLKMA
jgi:hypothetical protein